MAKCEYSNLDIGSIISVIVELHCRCEAYVYAGKFSMMYLGHEGGRDVFSFEPAPYCPNCGHRFSYYSFACPEFAGKINSYTSLTHQ